MKSSTYACATLLLLCLGAILVFSATDAIAPPNFGEGLKRDPPEKDVVVRLFIGTGCLMTGSILAICKK